jgi:hypothetical protein
VEAGDDAKGVPVETGHSLAFMDRGRGVGAEEGRMMGHAMG